METNIYNVLDDDNEELNITKIKIAKTAKTTNGDNVLNLNNYGDILCDQEIILPIKKKKGRKSKKEKMLEQEALEKNKVPPKLFPNLNEKIFDLVEIKGKEYFLDSDFGIVYDSNVNPVGIKKDNKYLLYADFELDNIENKILIDNAQIAQVAKLFK